MERVGDTDRVRGVLGDDGVDEVGPISRDVSDQGGPLGPQGLEERRDRGLVATWRGPQQRAGVVIDHHDQVLVTALVRDLIDPDSPDVREPVMAAVRHAIRINSVTVVFEDWVASHATVASKAYLWPAS